MQDVFSNEWAHPPMLTCAYSMTRIIVLHNQRWLPLGVGSSQTVKRLTVIGVSLALTPGCALDPEQTQSVITVAQVLVSSHHLVYVCLPWSATLPYLEKVFTCSLMKHRTCPTFLEISFVPRAKKKNYIQTIPVTFSTIT